MQPISENLKSAIYETWAAIAPDCEHCEDDEGRMEMVIDADRLLFFTQNTEAATELHQMFQQRGYSAVLKNLARQVPLGY